MPARFRGGVLLTASAALLVLPFHDGRFGLLSFVGFVPYFFWLKGKSRTDAFVGSFFWGCLFWMALGYWLGLVNVLGLVVLVAYLAGYFAVFGAVAAPFVHPVTETPEAARRARARAYLFVPAFWVLLEYARGWILGGIPWALAAGGLWKNLVWIQFADLTGVWGVSFFVVFVNLAAFRALEALGGLRDPETRREGLRAIAIGGAALALVGAYGAWRIASIEAPDASARVARVSVLQGNIPQDQKWDARIKALIFEKYKRLMFMAALEKPDLIVWPETSFPGYLEDEPVMATHLRGAVRRSQTHVLVGSPTIGPLEGGLRFFNSAVFFGPDGEELGRYAKLHLVPFGEYVPFNAVLGFMHKLFGIGRFTPGKEHTVFTVPAADAAGKRAAARFGVLICYEDIFPGLVRDFVREGADFLVNVTNDAWFGKSSAPYQHAQGSVFRAVENRVNVVRATNTGYSCFISPTGRILASVEDNGKEIFVTGTKTQPLTIVRRRTLYTRLGDWFVALCLALAFLSRRSLRRQEAYSRL